MVIVNKIFGAG